MTTTHSYKVGDILVASWGYSMIMVDFYKVLKTTAKTVTLAHIGEKDNNPTGFLCGTVMPNSDVIRTETCWRSGPVISASGARAPVEKEADIRHGVDGRHMYPEEICSEDRGAGQSARRPIRGSAAPWRMPISGRCNAA